MGGRGFLSDWNSPEWVLSTKACEVDDTTLLDKAITMTAEDNLENFYRHVRMDAIRNNATAILKNLIERGVSITPNSTTGATDASKDTLELLLAQGWNINAPSHPTMDQQPFMWSVVDNDDMVRWCLEHGASVHPQGQEPFHNGVTTKSRGECPQVLEIVAIIGSVATFELLRSKGAPLGWRSLHLAVEAATHGHPQKAGDDKSHGERMAMVRHLLDVVGLDVNAPDQPVGSKRLPLHNGTPICYIFASGMVGRDLRELIWLLLDRGADPTPALELAEGEYPQFEEEVKAWRAQGRQ